MKTVVAVNLSLAPLIVFWVLLAVGEPVLAVALAFAAAAALCAWHAWRRSTKSLEIFALAFFTALGVAHATGWAWASHWALSLSFAGLGLFSLVGAVIGRPWTAEYARADYAHVTETREFAAINRIITATWGGIFVFFALARALGLGLWPQMVVLALGTVASIFGPRALVRAMLRRRLGRHEDFDWPVPAIGVARGTRPYDVAVIGAGNGGLTAAALLADAGAKVVVAEQHDVVGGFAHNWRREIEHDGARRVFRFDAGVHDISGAWPGGPVASVLDRLGVADKVTWLPLDHTCRVGPLTFDVPRDWRAYARQLGTIFPMSASGIEAFFRDAHAIFEGMYSTAASNGGIPGPPQTLDELIAFPRRYPLAVRWMDRPFAEFLGSYVTDPAARNLISSLSGYVTDLRELLTVADMMPLLGYYFRGGRYPEGGSGKLAEVLAGVIRDRGGAVRLTSPVKRITVVDGKAAGIELATGERLDAQAVISNADYKRTFLDLIDPRHLSPAFREAIERIEPACSAFRVHLAVDFVPDIKPAQNIETDQGETLEIVLPSLIDPSAAPPGYATVEMTTLIPHREARSWFPGAAGEELNAWERAEAHRARRASLGDRLIELAETAIPDLRRHIVLRSDATPVTMSRFDWSTDGAIYGVRRSDRFSGSKTPLPGLVLAGSANFGGGTEAVVISGATAADTLMPGLLRRHRTPASARRAA